MNKRNQTPHCNCNFVVKKCLISNAIDFLKNFIFSNLYGSQWFTKEQLERKLNEKLTDSNYYEYVKMMERLAAHPYSYLVEDFIKQNRVTNSSHRARHRVAVPKFGEDGRSYVTIYSECMRVPLLFPYSHWVHQILCAFTDCRQKSAKADVTTISPGTGKISINGKDITYFKYTQPRQQVRSFPAHKFRWIRIVGLPLNIVRQHSSLRCGPKDIDFQCLKSMSASAKSSLRLRKN